jgi:hypothetical protein
MIFEIIRGIIRGKKVRQVRLRLAFVGAGSESNSTSISTSPPTLTPSAHTVTRSSSTQLS